ncbi:MAG TPA: 50S ribosomal protein L10 [Patescibacteria group bacterium]|nr:50S ribosomal protein L10 [Patescibacteria group bacterium]
MPKSKSKKQEEVEALTKDLQGAKSVMVITMTGLKVKENWEFRKLLRKEGVSLEVAKKTLFKIALEKAGVQMPVDDLSGTVALVMDNQEEARAAKLVANFKKTHPVMELQRGTVRKDSEWQVFDREQVIALSKLPSRQELVSKLLFLLQYPTSGFVRVLAALPQKFVRTLQAVHDKKAA